MLYAQISSVSLNTMAVKVAPRPNVSAQVKASICMMSCGFGPKAINQLTPNKGVVIKINEKVRPKATPHDCLTGEFDEHGRLEQRWKFFGGHWLSRLQQMSRPRTREPIQKESPQATTQKVGAGEGGGD
jgi:hypothetical protein